MDATVTSASNKRGKNLRFCPASSDLLYPRENKEQRKLEYYCKNCTHVEMVDDLQDHCVYVSETTTFTSADKTMIVQDVMSDPTLPRSKDVQCPRCSGNEAVFISASTEQGMTLYFSCADASCGHRWRDYV